MGTWIAVGAFVLCVLGPGALVAAAIVGRIRRRRRIGAHMSARADRGAGW